MAPRLCGCDRDRPGCHGRPLGGVLPACARCDPIRRPRADLSCASQDHRLAVHQGPHPVLGLVSPFGACCCWRSEIAAFFWRSMPAILASMDVESLNVDRGHGEAPRSAPRLCRQDLTVRPRRTRVFRGGRERGIQGEPVGSTWQPGTAAVSWSLSPPPTQAPRFPCGLP